MTGQKLTLKFLHPRDSGKWYEAQVAPECTAAIALNGLMSSQTGPFLPQPATGEPYSLSLARTKEHIPDSVTFGQVGAVSGDAVIVEQGAQGASR